MQRNDAERNITLGIFSYEVLALLPGSPLKPITRIVSDSPIRVGIVAGILAYHLHRHRKTL